MRITKQDLKIISSRNIYWAMYWLENGNFHREDGPSRIWFSGDASHSLNGKFYSEDNYWKEIHENY